MYLKFVIILIMENFIGGFVQFVCIIIVILALIGAFSTPTKQRRYKKKSIPKFSEPNLYKRKTKLISQNELRFYWALKKALQPTKDLIINCQTPLLSLLKTDNDEALRKIWSKRVDFTISSSNFEILAVIELDDSSHLRKSRIERDVFVNKILRENNHNLIRFETSKFYNPNEIKMRLMKETTIFDFVSVNNNKY